jgi:hypothetical protein
MAADGDGGKGGGGSGVLQCLKIRQSRASFEQVFWRAEKNTGVIIILRPQTPSATIPFLKKTLQSDVTLIHSENLH